MTLPATLRRMHPLWFLAAGAIALRLLLFLGRGDYVAFDEGWYLLLGRNLMAGDGYMLSGLRHSVLSPLFPVLSGMVDLVIDNPVWAGRIVAAVAGGLLVVPCWFLFLRFGGRITAIIGCLLVAVMPSLAPFVVPYWIGWDLWVGAEPVLHVLLYSGIALAMRALDRQSAGAWVFAGLTFGLAYLARPEAVIAFGIFVAIVFAFALLRRRPRYALGAALLVLGFAAAAVPYAIYLHEVQGRWTISGRQMAVSSSIRSVVPAIRPRGPSTDAPREVRLVEDMLWRDQNTYVRDLYALDATDTRLANGYWGAPIPVARAAAVNSDAPPAVSPLEAAATTVAVPPSVVGPFDTGPSSIVLYAAALGAIVPLFLLPLILIGVLPRKGNLSRELAFVLPLLGTSVLIAVAVAADPRTQLTIVPLAAFYAARGSYRIGGYVERRVAAGRLRSGFATGALTAVIMLLLLGTEARWFYFSTLLGSPHHVVGAENRRIGEALQQVIPPDAPIMSYHPALALFAKRDWRVLPQAGFTNVLRYANAIESEYIVLSPYYPTPLRVENNQRDYVLLRVPPGSAGAEQWQLQPADATRPYLSLTPGQKGKH